MKYSMKNPKIELNTNVNKSQNGHMAINKCTSVLSSYEVYSKFDHIVFSLPQSYQAPFASLWMGWYFDVNSKARHELMAWYWLNA